MRRLFGTDGIRGAANTEPMTAETALRVAMAAALQFRRGSYRHRVLIGKDTRLSGYLLEPALTAGFVSMGMDVILVGPMPTPAVAMLTRSLRADLGVMISASHNPFQDNGIKLFGPDGFKLADAVEDAIEARVSAGVGGLLADPAELGRAQRLDDASGRYIEAVKASFPRHLRLDGLKIALDCAHGAAYRVAPKILFELGATVIPLGDQPNGVNINDGVGATAPQALCRHVLDHGADIGVALDGDADRLIVVDETGAVIDGDQVMGVVAQAWLAAGRLKGGGVVATVMSNLGLERCLNEHGLSLVRVKVGDRYVVERMRAEGYNVGGEQSGHIVLGDYATTGDGLLAGLQVLAVMQERRRPLSQVARVFEPVPQRLVNVRFEATDDGATPLDHARVQAAVADAEARLGRTGRLLIRKSGTEPMIRVMAEADDPVLVDQVVGTLAATIRDVSRATPAMEAAE